MVADSISSFSSPLWSSWMYWNTVSPSGALISSESTVSIVTSTTSWPLVRSTLTFTVLMAISAKLRLRAADPSGPNSMVAFCDVATTNPLGKLGVAVASSGDFEQANAVKATSRNASRRAINIPIQLLPRSFVFVRHDWNGIRKSTAFPKLGVRGVDAVPTLPTR